MNRLLWPSHLNDLYVTATWHVYHSSIIICVYSWAIVRVFRLKVLPFPFSIRIKYFSRATKSSYGSFCLAWAPPPLLNSTTNHLHSEKYVPLAYTGQVIHQCRCNMCLFRKQRGVVWCTKEFHLLITRFTDIHALVTYMFA